MAVRRVGIVGLITTFLSLLVYLSYTPRVHENSPEFTSDTLPFVGSWDFFNRKWSFWKGCLGQHHVVSVSSLAARKAYLESQNLDFLHGNVTLLGLGPDYKLSLHDVFKPTFHNGRSYFQRRLVELTKTDQLARRLPRVSSDAFTAMKRLSESPSGVTNPCRIVFTDEVSDIPQLFERCLGYLSILQATCSRHNVVFPWLPSIALMKRQYGRYGLKSLVVPIIDKRTKKGAPCADYPLQVLLDNFDSKEYMTNFFISILFIAVANAGVLAGVLLNIVAHRTDWQERIYNEIKVAAAAHSQTDGPLVEQLASIPLEAWESSFPSIDLCFKEAIRMNTAFPMFRQNIGSTPIPIPGTNEVIPPGSFASYNTTDVHYDEDLYPNPFKFDPDRFQEGRKEFEKQSYSFLGWGHGKHPCLGMRWAKLQQNIILVYALAMYQWSGCDADGQSIPPLEPNINLDAAAPGLPQGIYCKYVPRQKA
ncbi:cytochrome P450 [Aspergillus alliaceus]|uniref:Cytochrome P450 n=1 Tax=Petromyces alliaceus TaxID=209559 RepID=A0A5N7BTY0_PETAA|nr:cytochrome P450 [Aspergillus alliaceus]